MRSSSEQKVTLRMSILMLRLMRRPPDSSIPRQFWKGVVMSEYVGTFTMVLSKFYTFTVMRLMSITLPFARVLLTTIQSPGLTISL